MNVEDLRQRQLEQLREAARILLKPMERLPFPVVIEAMTGRQVLPILNRPEDRVLLEKLARACMAIVADSRRKTFEANRPNDVSTQVERKLEAALRNFGIRVERPQAERGRSPEYNANNLEIYRDEAILMEGDAHRIIRQKSLGPEETRSV
jgi:hypothetical protein